MPILADAYRAFWQEVQTRLNAPDAEPEEQLRAPLERFLQTAGQQLGMPLRCIGETRLPDALGKPDFAVYRDDLLVGYIELKAPGAGADARRFKGRNREQFERFRAIPNLLYTDGEEWALYRNGELAQIVQLRGLGVPPKHTARGTGVPPVQADPSVLERDAQATPRGTGVPPVQPLERDAQATPRGTGVPPVQPLERDAQATPRGMGVSPAPSLERDAQATPAPLLDWTPDQSPWLVKG